MKDKIITYILLVLGFISSRLGQKARIALGRNAGSLLRVLDRKREAITVDNLKNAFPEKSAEECTNISHKAYHNLGIVLVEVPCLKYFDENDIRQLVHFENIELIDEVHKRGKGVILLSGHYGNWEFLAYTAGLYTGRPVLIIVKNQKNKSVDEILNNYRTRMGNQVVSMAKAARPIISTLRSGGTIALLADQSARLNNEAVVDFFGRPAATYSSPAELALKFDTPIICGFAERSETGMYTVRLQEIKHNDLSNCPEDVLELTRRHVHALENQIRKRPDLWAWQHRRWKPVRKNDEKS